MRTTNEQPIRRVRSHSPSLMHSGPAGLLDSAAFKRMVDYHANLKCRQALLEGKIRLVAPRSQPTIFIPRLDLVDDLASSTVVASFELPGVRNDEVSLRLENNTLLVEGERKPRVRLSAVSLPRNPIVSADAVSSGEMDVDNGDAQIKVPVQELRYGRFRRSLVMPAGVKSTDITARFQDGILIVTWPRCPSPEGQTPAVMDRAESDKAPDHDAEPDTIPKSEQV